MAESERVLVGQSAEMLALFRRMLAADREALLRYGRARVDKYPADAGASNIVPGDSNL